MADKPDRFSKPVRFVNPTYSKQFQLLRGLRPVALFRATEKLHPPKLRIRNFENYHLPFLRQKMLYPLFMHLSIFPAAAMACVNAVLYHSKTIPHQVFPKNGIGLSFFLGRGR